MEAFIRRNYLAIIIALVCAIAFVGALGLGSVVYLSNKPQKSSPTVSASPSPVGLDKVDARSKCEWEVKRDVEDRVDYANRNNPQTDSGYQNMMLTEGTSTATNVEYSVTAYVLITSGDSALTTTLNYSCVASLTGGQIYAVARFIPPPD